MNAQDYDVQAVKAARKAAGYRSQKAVAAVLDADPATIYRAEKGLKASYKLLKRLSELFGVPLSSWLYDTKPETGNLSQKNQALNAEKPLTNRH